jgi:hypothetical protein
MSRSSPKAPAIAPIARFTSPPASRSRPKAARKLKDRGAAREAGPAGEPIRYTVIGALDEAAEAPAEHDFKPAVIAESEKFLQEFSVSAAVLELDLTGAPVLVFRHATNGRVNVIYRRLDGNIGWVDPTVGDKGAA